MYKDKHGITKINPKNRDHLSISFDVNEDGPEKGKYPVLLHAPFLSDEGKGSDHSHIPLTRTQAILLRNWLNEYIDDTKNQRVFLPMPENSRDVHTEHCCKEHGCKYYGEDCTVFQGDKTQSFPCEDCE